MTTDSATALATDDDTPPRCWWLKRAALAVPLLLTAGVATVYFVDRHTRKAFDDDLAVIRASGEPAAWDDITVEAYNAPGNGALVYQRAFMLLSKTHDSPAASNLKYYRNAPPYDQPWWDLASGSEQANAQFFDVVHQAIGARFINWEDAPKTLADSVSFSNFGSIRHSVTVLADSALYQHLKAAPSDRLAWQRLGDAEAVGMSARSRGFIVGDLVAAGCLALSCNRLEIIAPALHVGEGPDDVPRADVTRRIGELMDDSIHTQALLAALMDERFFSTVEPESSAVFWPLRPIEMRGKRREIRKANAALAYAREMVAAGGVIPQPAEYQAALEDAVGFKGSAKPSLPRLSRYMSSSGEMDIARYFLASARVSAERQMAATSLATRLFFLDHKRWPADWDELVPAYLPRVPTDTTTAGRPPMSYRVVPAGRPDGEDRPIVMIGPAYITARTTPTDGDPVYEWDKAGLQFRDLSRFDVVPATGRPTTFPMYPIASDPAEGVN